MTKTNIAHTSAGQVAQDRRRNTPNRRRLISGRRQGRRDLIISSLRPDLLCGGAEMARFIYGDAGQKHRVYYMIREGLLPVRRIGRRIYASRRELSEFMGTTDSDRAVN